MRRCRRRLIVALLAALVFASVSGCWWRGLNSLPLPGTGGSGPGSFTVQAQMPEVANLKQNSRVRVGDAVVGTVTKIERQGWHALVTMQLGGDVNLPANATAKLGQTSLLGSMHIELAPPARVPPEGKLHDGSLIPLPSAGAYPSTEQTLAAVSLLLNGGAIGQIQDITRELTTSFNGREQDLRSLIEEFNKFVGHLNDQTGDIIAATESLNNLASQFANQEPVIDRALKTIPEALAVLKDERANLTDAVDQLGKFSAVTTQAVNKTKENLVAELNQLGPVLESLANAGPALTRSLSVLSTYPWPNETVEKWFRGDYANLTAVVDLTLSRLDAGLFTGSRWEGHLTELEMQWGRTIGQLPSPYTAGNPLIAPYHWDQGP
ncbi:MCE family protein [Mycobacterium seoulense]|uniref:MCE family protein n=1 Tax=Mycobacterium seoulense TaxID=386911 RepID=UPI003CECC2EC